MAKFSGSNASTLKQFPSNPTGKTKGPARTHEGGSGFEKGDKLALYTLAVTNMGGEPTFYESAPNRDNRFKDLVAKVAVKDPEWMAAFIPFLRDTANMRTASVICAVEASRAILAAKASGKDIDVSVRQLIAGACSRADEPAEVIGYWLANYGRPIPPSIRRGVADATSKLYNQYSAVKYDGLSRGVRPGDVIEFVHPTPRDEVQSALFGYLLDRRHGHEGEIPEVLTKIRAAAALEATPAKDRRAVLAERGHEALAEAGFTWERLSGWLPGGMDAQAWESIIPNMGYMALLRNLRNFEQANVAKTVLKDVRDKLEDPEEVARSRQFPFRFWSAYKATGSLYFASALETALDLSCQNIPEFPGRTLVAIDTSGSMQNPVSGRSDTAMYQIAALFAAAVANKAHDCTTIIYGNSWAPLSVKPSVLRTIEEVGNKIGHVGHGTETWPSVVGAIQKHGPFDRICVFTDMQDHPAPSVSYLNAFGRSRTDFRDQIPAHVPVFVWDLAGYAKANIDTSTPGRYLLGGFTDASFRIVSLLDAGRTGSWPWEV